MEEEIVSNWRIIFLYVILPALIIWEAIWKAIALWKAGRNNHLYWFIAIFVINSLGILPIIYLIILKKRHRKKNFEEKTSIFSEN